MLHKTIKYLDKGTFIKKNFLWLFHSKDVWKITRLVEWKLQWKLVNKILKKCIYCCQKKKWRDFVQLKNHFLPHGTIFWKCLLTHTVAHLYIDIDLLSGFCLNELYDLIFRSKNSNQYNNQILWEYKTNCHAVISQIMKSLVLVNR